MRLNWPNERGFFGSWGGGSPHQRPSNALEELEEAFKEAQAESCLQPGTGA